MLYSSLSERSARASRCPVTWSTASRSSGGSAGGVALVLCPLACQLAVQVSSFRGGYGVRCDRHVHEPVPRVLQGV